jgi:tetratricopeptide (TPR) repeat protein
MADIFISYARPTAKLTRTIAGALESAGHSVWFDEAIPAHRDYADVISEQLEEARAVIVIWSAQAAASQWVRSEANRAREKGTLIQLRADSTRLPMPFDQIQCLDFRRWRGDTRDPAWQRLVATINELILGEVRLSQAKFEPRSPSIARRTLLYGAIATVAAVGLFGWDRFKPDKPSPEVEVRIQKAFGILQDGSPDEYAQAIVYLQEATQLAPHLAFAWGALAFGHALNKFHGPVSARAGADARSRSAARAALDLDPNEAFANCSLVALVPPYRNWARLESRNRNLAERFRKHPLPNSLLGDLLGDLGRWNDALDVQSNIDRKRFVIPLSDRSIIQTLWSAGKIQRAEAMLAEAVERWPKHPAIWNQRIKFLTHSGRADEAARLLEDTALHPAGYPEPLRRSSLETAKAIVGAADRDSAVRKNLAMLETGHGLFVTFLNRKFSMAQLVAQRAATLGDLDTAFALLDGYYFARGKFAGLAPEAGDEDRMTSNLFEPPMSNLWPDARFAALTREIGLDGHWRNTGKKPDFQSS